jgi:hypothetical protein
VTDSAQKARQEFSFGKQAPTSKETPVVSCNDNDDDNDDEGTTKSDGSDGCLSSVGSNNNGVAHFFDRTGIRGLFVIGSDLPTTVLGRR